MPKDSAMMCPHFTSIDESLRATLVALKHNPSQVELMDDIVLECTKSNPEQRDNRVFVNGDPKALLMVELHRDSPEELDEALKALEADFKLAGLGYDYPVLKGADVNKALTLRKAGLGLLANIPGDDNAQPVIEDTAVDVQDLPEFIAEFNVIMDGYGQKCVHYAHAGSGEIHLRPVLNMKTEQSPSKERPGSYIPYSLNLSHSFRHKRTVKCYPLEDQLRLQLLEQKLQRHQLKQSVLKII